MKTGFEIDWTGVYKPILTVFNGGKRKTARSSTKRSLRVGTPVAALTAPQKVVTRKSKKTRKSRKTKTRSSRR